MQRKTAALLLVAATMGATHNVSAANLPVKAPVYKAPRTVVAPDPWAGWYVGGHIGGGWTHDAFYDPTGVVATSVFGDKASGFLGGPQLGYNWQFSSLVLGIQGDISFTNMNASATAPLFPTTTISNDTKWISTLTGRIGYAWDKMLWYGKGGEAWVRNNYAAVDPTLPVSFTANITRTGYVAGGGWEYAFAPNWSGFVEYDYIGVSNKNVVVFDPANPPTAIGTIQNIQMVKAGLNFKLTSWPAVPWSAMAMSLPRW